MFDKEQDSPTDSLTDEDWQILYAIALEEGVAPYLYYCLKKSEPDICIPPEIRKKFVKVSQNVLAKNTVLFHELGIILRLFSDNDIPVIILKGAYLSEIVYPHNGLRPMGDLDLLVKKGDLNRTQEKLLEMGYTQSKHLSVQEQCAKSHHLVPFTNRAGITIEVHWTLSHPILRPFEIDVNGLWKRAQSVNIAGVNVHALSPEDVILHLSLHTSYHHLFILWLKSFCDITEVIRHYRDEIGWDQVQKIAHTWKVGRYAYLTFNLLNESFGFVVPGKVLFIRKPEGFNPEVITLVREKIFAERDKNPMDRKLAQLWGAKRSKVKAILQIFKIVFPPKDIVYRKYNFARDSPMIFLYYLVHLVDLIFRYNRSVLRLFYRNTRMMASVERATRSEMLKDKMRLSNE
jgi:hypothetical protein